VFFGVRAELGLPGARIRGSCCAQYPRVAPGGAPRFERLNA